jgi:hypothetical protein
VRSRPTATAAVYYDQNLVPRQILAPTHCASVLPLKDGSYMVFQANDAGASPYAQLIDRNGALVGPQKPIAARTEPISYTDFVARKLLADGSYLIVWNANYLTSRDFKLQRYTSKGDPIGQVVSLGVFPRDVLPLADGDAVLVGDLPNPQDPAVAAEIYLQRLSDPEEMRHAPRHWRHKYCHAQTKGMAGQVRKAFMDQCFANRHER